MSIDATVPFLFRFAKPCLSPRRYAKAPEAYYYDEAVGLVRWRNGADDPPAVIQAGNEPPQTKKCDIEKGEDNKDNRMWR